MRLRNAWLGKALSKSFDFDAITIDQVTTAHEILVSLGFPPELVAIILDLAEYWCVQQYSRKTPFEMESGKSLFWLESSSLYLQTGPIRYGEGFDSLPLITPRKTIFRTSSRDRGAEMFDEDRGPYEKQYSWFDASIFRVDECWTGGNIIEPIHAVEKTAPEGFLRGATTAGGDDYTTYYLGNDPSALPSWLCKDGTRLVGGFKMVRNGEKQMWLLQRNRRASVDFVEHEIKWERERIDGIEE
jgi:hypothetical protein